MAGMLSRYITVDYEVKEYSYIRKSYADTKHKPLCPNNKCGTRLLYVKQGRNNIGFICTECNSVYINPPFRVFKNKEALI